MGQVQIVSSHTTSMARGRLGSLTPSAAACDPAACKPVRASIFACLPACISEWDAADPVAEPVDLCAFPAADPVAKEPMGAPADPLAVAAAPSRRARSPAEDASPAWARSPAKASRAASPANPVARRLELADDELGWSDDGSGSDSEPDEGEDDEHRELAVFDLRHATSTEC